MAKKELTQKSNKNKPVAPKDTKNQEKLMELLEDLPTLHQIKKGDKKEEPVETHEDQTSKEWLKEQVAKLSEENEKLKKDLVIYKEQYDLSLVERPTREPSMYISPEEENTKREVLNLFRELENNYLGRNPQRQVYKMVKVDHILKRMNSMFPFLKPI